MRKSRQIGAASAALGMMFLILDSKTALIGARDGIHLAMTALIPSLFPFLFLSFLLTDRLQGIRIRGLRPVARLFHIPKGAEILVIPAFLGGYPAGAQAVGQAYRNGVIDRETSEKILAFCNNSGPSFLFGMAAACFPKKWMVWALWLFHILGAWAAAVMEPCDHTQAFLPPKNNHTSVTEILKQSLSVMSMICGWIILFRIVIAFADRWFLWLLPAPLRVGLIGLLELSNGICELVSIADERIRFLLCAFMISLGGICVTLQTCAVTQGLGKERYCKGKAIQMSVSLCCCAALVYRNILPIAVLLSLLLLFAKNRSRNPDAVSV